MLSTLQMIFKRLIANVQTSHHRYLYPSFQLNNRLTGLSGPRGVGKTTLLLQHIKANDPQLKNSFYFSADHIYFQSNTLYTLVEKLFLEEGIQYFYIDEIHQYPDWQQELKNLYDGFPKMFLVFSGSSSLDLVKGSYDLSRRAKMYHLTGLSFREYLNFYHQHTIAPMTFDALVGADHELLQSVAHIPGLMGFYHTYLTQGFYPFFHEDPASYHEKLLTMIDQTIHEDIANFYQLKTGNLRYFGKILNFLATIPPGKVSTYNLGKNLSISDKTAGAYLIMLQETGLIEIIYATEEGNQGLRKPEKVFFNNTNLLHAMNQMTHQAIDIGTLRELAFVQSSKGAGLQVFHNKHGDYQINGHVFEVGGKNKGSRQIKGLSQAWLVKDDTLASSGSTLPLWSFGLLY